MASEKEYIERGALIEAWNRETEDATDLFDAFDWALESVPAADVVSKGVYEQVQWERDMAMQQLEEHGIPFGANVDVVEVRHGEWKKRGNEKKCSVCDFIYYSNADEWSWCPNCGAKMDGERKEQT